MNIKERTSKKLDDWKDDIHHLEHQLGQSQEEAKVFFDKQKNSLLEWTGEIKKEVDKLEDFGEDKVKSLKANLEELRLQAALGKAEANDAYNERQKQLNHSIHNTKLAISKLEKNASKDSKIILNNITHTLDKYHTKFDLFRLQLELGKKDASQNWHDKKKEINLSLHKVKTHLAKAQESTSDKWDHFSEEISEAWTHLKKAIK